MIQDHWYFGAKVHEILSTTNRNVDETNTILDRASELIDKFITGDEPRDAPYTFYRAIEQACKANEAFDRFLSDYTSFQIDVADRERYGQVDEWRTSQCLHDARRYSSLLERIKRDAACALDLIESVFKYY